MDSDLILLEWLTSCLIEKELDVLKATVIILNFFSGEIIDLGDE